MNPFNKSPIESPSPSHGKQCQQLFQILFLFLKFEIYVTVPCARGLKGVIVDRSLAIADYSTLT